MNITQEQLDEFIKCKNDIVYFSENYVQHISMYDGVKKLELYPYQIQVLEDDILTAETSRQIGFSLCSHIKILHSIIFNQEKTIVFFTQSRDRSSHSIQNIATLLDICTLTDSLKPKFVIRNKTELRFDNNTRVLSVSNGSHIRGYGISELYIEEVDFLKESIEDLLHSIIPCMVGNKNPTIWAWSFPSNDNINRVKEVLEKRKNHKHYNLSWYVIPNRDSKWKTQYINNIGEEQFKREFICNFSNRK